MACQVNSSFLRSHLFGFLNANHSKTASILLNNDILQKLFDIVFLNEPYYTDFGIPFFNKNIKIISV